jgi:hypothetical protein
MSTLSVAPGLFPFTLTFANGSTRTVLASSLSSAVTGVFASEVVSAVRGAAFAGEVAPPVVTGLVPPSAKLGDPNFTLHVNGTGFKQGATILWNGSPEPTTFVSATELTTGVNMATAQVAMPIPVAVRSLAGLDSNAVDFDLQPAAVAEEAPATV